MDKLSKELNINTKNIFATASPTLFAVVVHNTWLQKWLKNAEVDNCVNNLDFTLQPGESVPYPWRKIFIKVNTTIFFFFCIFFSVIIKRNYLF